MSIESIRNSGSVYQGSSPVQGTIRESSTVTTEGQVQMKYSRKMPVY